MILKKIYNLPLAVKVKIFKMAVASNMIIWEEENKVHFYDALEFIDSGHDEDPYRTYGQGRIPHPPCAAPPCAPPPAMLLRLSAVAPSSALASRLSSPPRPSPPSPKSPRHPSWTSWASAGGPPRPSTAAPPRTSAVCNARQPAPREHSTPPPCNPSLSVGRSRGFDGLLPPVWWYQGQAARAAALACHDSPANGWSARPSQ